MFDASSVREQQRQGFDQSDLFSPHPLSPANLNASLSRRTHERIGKVQAWACAAPRLLPLPQSGPSPLALGRNPPRTAQRLARKPETFGV